MNTWRTQNASRTKQWEAKKLQGLWLRISLLAWEKKLKTNSTTRMSWLKAWLREKCFIKCTRQPLSWSGKWGLLKTKYRNSLRKNTSLQFKLMKYNGSRSWWGGKWNKCLYTAVFASTCSLEMNNQSTLMLYLRKNSFRAWVSSSRLTHRSLLGSSWQMSWSKNGRKRIRRRFSWNEV